MIVIRYKEDPTAAILGMGAIILLAGSLGFMLFAPRPSADAAVRKLNDQAFKARLAADKAKDSAAESTLYISKRSWKGVPDNVAPAALATVTGRAKQRGLIVLSFRPTTSTIKGEPVQLPFLATVQGSYTAVLAFAKDLETPATKLAVTNIMISSADAASDKVTGTIGLVAFMDPAATQKLNKEKSGA